MDIELNWEEKYRPKTLDTMILETSQYEMLKEFINQKTCKNLLLAGHQGIGKTSLAKVIVSELDSSFLYINCGMENGVDLIRNKVSDFCSITNLKESPKIVILDEADSLTGNTATGSSAQSSLRNLIESSADDTRFILTCNYINRIIPPIKSRCLLLDLQRFTKQDVLKYCVEILKKEGVKASKETLTEFSKDVVSIRFPDIRSIIANLEAWSITKVLKNPGSDKTTEIEDLLKSIMEAKSAKDARTVYINKEDVFARNYEALAGELFNRLTEPKDLLICAEQIYKMSMVLDKEIQFYSLILQFKS